MAERSNATVLLMSQQGKHSAAERERMVSLQGSANKTAGLKDRRLKNSFGWVAERSNATVLKTAEGATLPGVRIPPHPPVISNIPW